MTVDKTMQDEVNDSFNEISLITDANSINNDNSGDSFQMQANSYGILIVLGFGRKNSKLWRKKTQTNVQLQ